jgi:predicted metal-binding membrane protein
MQNGEDSVYQQRHLPRSTRDGDLPALAVIVVVTAWCLIGLAVLTQHADLVDHHQLMGGHVMFMGGHYMRMGGLHLPWVAALAVFLASWQVMTAAMMLPASLPLVGQWTRANRAHARPWVAPAVFLAGYATGWTAFGLAAFLGDLLLMRLEDTWPWLADHPWAVGAATLALAGAYELSPLKARWLMACRDAAPALASYDRPDRGSAWSGGLRHGAHCVGSCGALMAIMFGMDLAAVPLMVALTAVMLAEQTLRHGQRLTPLVGSALILLAAATWIWGS